MHRPQSENIHRQSIDEKKKHDSTQYRWDKHNAAVSVRFLQASLDQFLESFDRGEIESLR